MKKISIILLVILFLGCRTIKNVEQLQHTKKDSVSYVERVKIDTIRIPGEKIQIELPCDELKSQSSAQGKAKVKAEPKGDGYFVVFTCDSIEKLVISKDREINRLSDALRVSNTTKTKELTFLQAVWIKIGKCLTFVLALYGVVILLVKWKVLP